MYYENERALSETIVGGIRTNIPFYREPDDKNFNESEVTIGYLEDVYLCLIRVITQIFKATGFWGFFLHV